MESWNQGMSIANLMIMNQVYLGQADQAKYGSSTCS